MNQFIVTLILLLFSMILHAECPSTLTYSNGNYMKSGNTLYYPNGNYLKSGSTLYYPNGNYLKSGSTLYYSNGNYLKSGSTLYYPNGNYLKSGSTLYYSNGNYLKSGTTFYHKNGNYARSGQTLYRENGEHTSFPLHLKEAVGDLGFLHARIASDSERLNLTFSNLIPSENVKLRHLNNLLGDDGSGAHTVFILKTGHPGEAMRVSISETGDIQCQFQDEFDEDERVCSSL